jgi:NAD(P)-dependent dehydrogenase (short-subunit alcohol dehydrogenase family)
VHAGEFASITALVIGGSRGLGALTARSIVAGGGRVIISFAVGAVEADAIVQELGADACQAIRFDALSEAGSQLANLRWNVDQLYYFASPHISRQKSAWYAPERFADFCEMYVNGFQRVCSALHDVRPNGLAAFYPSSIFVEERPRDMVEYAMAKAAGETLCVEIERTLAPMRVIAKRLPRLLTDQTATILPSESRDAFDVMLPIIREMREAVPGGTPTQKR